ncbi:MAG: dihydroneopterin aldolase [Aquabacterium sp.]
MDELILEGLEVGCRVGCTDAERALPQSLRVDVRLGCGSLQRAGQTDDLSLAVDYRIATRMAMAVADGEYLLLERVAEIMAEVALADPLVHSVDLTLRKRPPVQSLAWAGVRIHRQRPSAFSPASAGEGP